MKYNTSSKVEGYFSQFDNTYDDNLTACKTQVLTIDNYITLGQLTALRFIEWVSLNPGGVVALPTGKTPEFFIKWIQYYLDNWDAESKHGLIAQLGIAKPDFGSCHFFQLDEFFPINPENERSFQYFVKKYYIDVLGFDSAKTHLINTYYINEKDRELLGGAQTLNEIFTEGGIDLSLRVRTAQSRQEELQQRAIHLYDEYCADYEKQIRDLGGIGFFLGGIGPDGHIAFNVRGSSHFSHTRLTGLNYESQAAAAGDLGGISMVRKKAVITMGLETITYNPDCVAIIIAAGQSKAKVVAGSLLNEPAIDYPATCLQQLPAARFFITAASSVLLPKSESQTKMRYDATKQNHRSTAITDAFVEKLLIDALLSKDISLDEVISHPEQWNSDQDFAQIEKLTGRQISAQAAEVKNSIGEKIDSGLHIKDNQVILHTGPHHDDIELAYFPYLHHLVRSKNIQNHFAYCTSGYTSVTSGYLISVYRNILQRINPTNPTLRDQNISHVLDTTYQDDLTHYLRGIAQLDQSMQDYAVARRMFRKWYERFSSDANSYQAFVATADFITDQLGRLEQFEIGRREPEEFHLAKGWLREFEAELVWAHFGLGSEYVHHLRLPFYSDDIFPHYPDFENDVKPILELLEKVRPTTVSLALDPEGSGPDTHFKTLIALSAALEEYHAAHPEIDLHVWGYRNVWSRYHISEANTMIPVSLNSFSVIKGMFNTCYLSQKSADFPSYEYDGPFSELAQKVWVDQHNDVCKLMGDNYFYESDSLMMQRAYGMIYLKDMTYEEFKQYMVPVKRLLQTKDTLSNV